MKQFKQIREAVAGAPTRSVYDSQSGKYKTEPIGRQTTPATGTKPAEPGREAQAGKFVSARPKLPTKPTPQVTSEDIERVEEMDKSQTPPGRDGGHQFEPGPKVSKKDIEAVKKNPAKHLSDLFAKEYSKKKVKEQGVAEGRPDVMRHTGDRGVRVVRRGGKPIGEIGIDAEASPGSGQYYVKLYDGSVDLSGYDTAEEALDDIKSALGLKEDTPVPTAMGAATSQATAPAQSQAQSAALATAQQQQQKREMQDEMKNKQAEISQLQKSMVSV